MKNRDLLELIFSDNSWVKFRQNELTHDCNSHSQENCQYL